MSFFDELIDGFLGRTSAPEASADSVYGSPNNPVNNNQGIETGNTSDIGNESESTNDFGDSGMSGDNTFLWKPQSDHTGTLAILLPASISANQVTLVDQNGNVIDRGVLSTSGDHPNGRTNGNRLTYRFSRPGGAYQNVRVLVDGKEFTSIGNGSQRIENSNGRTTSSSGSNTGFNTITNPNGVTGVLPNNYNAFESLTAPTLNAQTPPLVPYEYIDPLMSAERTGDFNTRQFGKVMSEALAVAPGIANQLTDANVAQQDELNEIAQDRLTSRVETQLPGFIEGTREDLKTARTLSEGSLPDFIDEAVVFGSARNSAADLSTFSGFGAGSVFGRTATDRMDAQNRLGLMETGISMTDRLANRAFGTFIDKPIRATAVDPSAMFSSITNALTPMNTIGVDSALNSQTQQSQWDNSRIQNYANQTAQNIQAVDQYNIGNQFGINQAVSQQNQINNAQGFNAYQSFFNAVAQYGLANRQLNGLQNQQEDVATADGINQILGLGAQIFGGGF